MSEMTLSHLRSLFWLVFVIIGVALAVASFGMAEVATAAEKRRWEPRAVACIVALFLVFVATQFWSGSLPWRSLVGPLLVVPAITLRAFIDVKQTKYCDECNATLPTSSSPEPQRFCPYCGAELDGKPSPDDGYLD